MIHFLYAFSLLGLLVSGTAHARWLTVQESGGVFEKYLTDYHVNQDGSWTQTTEYVVRVQAEDAKNNLSLFPIEYNALTEKVTIEEAFTQNGRAKIPVDPAAIEDRDKGESKDYDAMKVRSVVFPQVEIGSRLHLKYRTDVAKSTMPGRWSTEVVLTPGNLIEKFAVRVKSELPLQYEVSDPRRLITVTQHGPKSIEIKNRKPLPGWVQTEKDPYFHPASDTRVGLSSHAEWPVFLKPVDSEFERVLGAGLPRALKSWVAKAGAKKDSRQRVLYLLDKISSDLRYFGDWRRHDGGIVPRPLAEIESSGYGDCKDLSTLLVALLRELKIDASVALVRRGDNPWGDEPEYILPVLNRFNHAVVRARWGGETFWLDPTNPVTSLQAYSDIAGRPAWVVGHGFARIPAAQAGQYVHEQKFAYRFQPDGGVQVDVEAELQGLAAFETANDLMALPRSEVLSDALEYFSEGQEVKTFKYIHEPRTTRELKDMKIALQYQTGRVTYQAGKASFFAIPDGVIGGPFFETEGRESDLRLGDEPYVFHSTRRLKNTRLAQEPLPRCAVQSPWMSLKRQVQAEGRDIVIDQTIELKKPYIARAEFQSEKFKKLQAETRECFYRAGVLIEPYKVPLSLAE